MQTFRHEFQAMASRCEVVLVMDDARAAQALAQEAAAEVKRIETKFSRYLGDSIVSRINAAAGGQPVACDDETWSLLGYADSLHQTSGGLFDITSGVLRRAWNFKAVQPRVPTEQELDPVRRLIGWGRVERHERRVRLPQAGMEIDFGGFGKEYAADRAGALLAQRGVRHGYVNLAGDIRVVGPKPDGQRWMIGIQHPRVKGQLLATIPLGQGGLATSGDYERFFELDGKRYCHVLDPKSGMPVTQWQSISVIAPLTVVAGNCTTIGMLKQDQALAFLESTGMNYLAVDQQGRVHQKTATEPAMA